MEYEYEKQQDFAKKLANIQYINVAKLLQMKNQYYPNADEVEIRFGAEYNDEGYSLQVSKLCFHKDNPQKEELEENFDNDPDKEDNFYDLYYDLVQGASVGEDFSGSIRFDFTKMAFIV